MHSEKCLCKATESLNTTPSNLDRRTHKFKIKVVVNIGHAKIRLEKKQCHPPVWFTSKRPVSVFLPLRSILIFTELVHEGQIHIFIERTWNSCWPRDANQKPSLVFKALAAGWATHIEDVKGEKTSSYTTLSVDLGSDVSDDTSEYLEVHNMVWQFSTHTTSMPETSEEAVYLLEMARADLEVRRLEKDLAERVLHQFRMRKHHLLLQAKKARRKFGDAEAHVGRMHAHLMRLADEYALLGSVSV
ncbi:hypothetical protein F4604DRAFT_1674363 [Suillus subluteus]|nr:hypothetical protein F4604DRAFT_1674363 [Suillus subluteus]